MKFSNIKAIALKNLTQMKRDPRKYKWTTKYERKF